MTSAGADAFVCQWRIKPVKPKSPKVRCRAWAPKVRTGCPNCKRRRLKCGEERPACQRCLQAGLKCEYATAKAWVISSPSPPDKASSPPADPSAPPSSWGEKLDLNEQRALVYFKERTAPILSSFAHGSAQFWTRIIPILSITNLSVRSAMIATSSLHENVHYRGHLMQPAITSERLYAKHLSKSISALTIPGQPPSQEVVLMTCLLFLACENLKKSSAAQVHVQSGLKLLREWKKENPSNPSPAYYIADSCHDVIENTLEPIFARLEAQLSVIKDPAQSRADFQTYDLNWERPVVPDLFPDLFAARDCMHEIQQWCSYQSRLNGGPLLSDNPSHRAVAKLANQWNRTFEESFSQCDDRTWPGWSVGAALRFWQLCFTFTLHDEAIDSVTFWDERLDDVKCNLDVCTDILASGPPSTNQHDSLWLYDFCLIPPLVLTAIHCRHPAMRRKAIALMRMQHCWYCNDPFNACRSAKICEIIVTVEESGLCKPPLIPDDVPKSNRIRPLMVWLADPGKITLYYARIGDPAILKEVVEWEHWAKPAVDTLFLYPLGEILKYISFQGLIRPARTSCVCKNREEDWTTALRSRAPLGSGNL